MVVVKVEAWMKAEVWDYALRSHDYTSRKRGKCR